MYSKYRTVRSMNSYRLCVILTQDTASHRLWWKRYYFPSLLSGCIKNIGQKHTTTSINLGKTPIYWLKYHLLDSSLLLELWCAWMSSSSIRCRCMFDTRRYQVNQQLLVYWVIFSMSVWIFALPLKSPISSLKYRYMYLKLSQIVS